MSDYTTTQNLENVKHVQQQILMKLGYNPYFATEAQARSIVTDFDTHPYPRFYRGVHNSSIPVVLEREAGYRQQRDECYNFNPNPAQFEDLPSPTHCFQAPCSTTYPCYPEQIRAYSSQNFLETILNRTCVNQYR